jgi:Tol biopolymer transport system component
MLVESETGEITDLGIEGSHARYVRTGHLVFGHEASQSLRAVPFDLETRRVTGEAVTVLPEVLVHYSSGATQFAVSETGTAVYARAGDAAPGNDLRLVSVDGEGRETPMPLRQGSISWPRFSRDGRSLTYFADGRIWVWNRDSGANISLTTGVATDRYPFWSRNGSWIYYSSDYSPSGRTPGMSAFRARADGSTEPELLFGGDSRVLRPSAESPDGTQLLVQVGGVRSERGVDLVVATLGSDGVTFTDYLVGPWNEGYGTISPDGTRAAYVSDERGVEEVYVRAFPAPGDALLVSEGGGTDPVWEPGGGAVYYISAGALWRADIEGDGIRSRRRLFEGSWIIRPNGIPFANWDVHPDGRSYVFVKAPSDGGGSDDASVSLQLEVVVNWFEELRQLVGGAADGR